MKLYDYIPEALLMQRIEEGYVNQNFHKKFPLAIYTYSKSATFDYVWDEATCKCRGLIVDLRDMTILARPFEKFFNVAGKAGITREQFPTTSPIITDKLDGNLITLYKWQSSWYAASKGSFHSEHADWANEWLARNATELAHFPREYHWPEGYTPVFEMIAEELEHHVVHYGKGATGLYLLALINNETGEELNEQYVRMYATENNIRFVYPVPFSMKAALAANVKNAEGYVLSWPRFGQTPVRVKVKFPEFLRLQKLVHNIGPKEILDYMRKPELKCYLDEVLDHERSHEVFIEYTKKWMARFQTEYTRIEKLSVAEFFRIEVNVELQGTDRHRKVYAQLITNPEYCTYPEVMFAGFDLMNTPTDDSEARAKRKARLVDIIWKQVELIAEQVDDVRSIITQEE